VLSSSGTSDQPLHDKFEESKRDEDKKKGKKQKGKDYKSESDDEEDVVNEIDTFLIEDDDL
jgi:hypothetical protein